MGVMHEPIENRITKRGVADQVVPVIDRDLAGHQGRATARAVLHDLEEIAPFAIPQRREAPVIELCGAPHNLTYGKCVVMWSRSG